MNIAPALYCTLAVTMATATTRRDCSQIAAEPIVAPAFVAAGQHLAWNAGMRVR
jgi:hypothetical protein